MLPAHGHLLTQGADGGGHDSPAGAALDRQFGDDRTGVRQMSWPSSRLLCAGCRFWDVSGGGGPVSVMVGSSSSGRSDVQIAELERLLLQPGVTD
jgi:hypothetical protein